MLARLVFIRYKSSPAGFRRIGDDFVFWSGTVVIQRRSDPLVMYSKKVAHLEPENESATISKYSGQSKSVKFSVSRLIRALFCGTMILFPGQLPSTQASTPIVLSMKELVKLTGGSITLTRSEQGFPLIFDYYTADFNTVMDQTWHCYASDCNDGLDCDSHGPLGVWVTHKYDKCAYDDDMICIYRKFCSVDTTGCFARDGCLKWTVTYKIRNDSFFRVFSLGQSTDWVSVDSIGFDNTPVKSVRIINHYDKDGASVILDSKGESYLCPFGSNKLTPEPGKLGDIQMSFNQTFLLSWHQTMCRSQVQLGVSCDSIKSFPSLIPTLCSRLPTQADGYEVSFRSGVLYFGRDRNVEVTVNDSVAGDEDLNSTPCSIRQSELYGTRAGFQSYTLALIADLTEKPGVAEFLYSCDGNSYQVECDGLIHLFAVGPPSLCKNAPNVMKVSEIDAPFVDASGKRLLKSSRRHNNIVIQSK